jgi:methylenetetrahydrofolate dehydrogenase (NADP+)/methenyltetrahydrofolate cyclohydrolase
MEKILSGKPVAQAITEDTKQKLLQVNRPPVMALLRVGDDPASSYYIQNIVKQGTKLGMDIRLLEFDISITNDDFVAEVKRINTDSQIDAIMIQKPLPKHLNDELVNSSISIDKDIDGLNPENLGKLFLQQECFAPCTARAVVELIKFYNIQTQAKHAVIIGRSPVVGKPLMAYLLHKASYGNATVSVCHSLTSDISEEISRADIVIAAIGKPNFVTAEMIKNDAVCIDVGINLLSDAEKGDYYVGDIDYQSCFDKAQAITPVPGGIGSITTAILLNNLVQAALINLGKA